MNLQYKNIYDSLSLNPLLQSRQLLCAECAQVTQNLLNQPTCASASGALNWLQQRKTDIYNVLGACAWTYACSPQQPPLHWGTCLSSVEQALLDVIMPRDYSGRACQYSVNSSHEWQRLLDKWQKFYLSIRSGCCVELPDGNLGARYVIRQTPNKPPFFGRTICLPTLTPSKITERSYNTRGECELALSQLPPQVGAVPNLNGVYCNQYGCYNEPEWGRAPAYTLECVGGAQCGTENGCCGPSLELGYTEGTLPN